MKTDSLWLIAWLIAHGEKPQKSDWDRVQKRVYLNFEPSENLDRLITEFGNDGIIPISKIAEGYQKAREILFEERALYQNKKGVMENDSRF